jgi:hypothetical protein
MRFPEISGRPIEVAWLAAPRRRRGDLVSGGTQGQEVHAGAFLRRRRIVLDVALKRRPALLRRIWTHELFHFVWVRLGNCRRESYQQLLAGEIRRGARGELGWSAEWRKEALKEDDVRRRTRRWREYACESFCDTAAWLLSAVRASSEYTLNARDRARRRQWFLTAGLTVSISV